MHLMCTYRGEGSCAHCTNAPRKPYQSVPIYADLCQSLPRLDRLEYRDGHMWRPHTHTHTRTHTHTHTHTHTTHTHTRRDTHRHICFYVHTYTLHTHLNDG